MNFYVTCSDGAPSQYKNNYNMMNLSFHKEDFGLSAVWTFTSSGHGKSACDGLGACVKCAARKYLLKHGPEVAFSSPKDFYQFILEKMGKICSPDKVQSVCQSCDEIIDASDNQECSTDEETDNVTQNSSKAMEVKWLDTEQVEEIFQTVLKPRWNDLSSKSNGFISSTYFLYVYRI